MNWRASVLVMLAASGVTLSAAGPGVSNAPPATVLLLDNLGRAVDLPTNEVHH